MVIKFCTECDEGFAEKFQFCPTCGELLEAFEMAPVRNEADESEGNSWDKDDRLDDDFTLIDEQELNSDDDHGLTVSSDDRPVRISNSDEVGPWALVAQSFKRLFYFVGGIGGLVLVILIFVKGVIWYQDNAYPVVSVLTALPILFLFPSGLILGIFRKTRGLGGLFLIISSVLYMSGCWAQSLAFAYVYLGKVWMLVGFFLAGVGVFVMAFIGAIIQGEYMDALMIVASVLIFFTVHFGGFWMAANRDQYLAENPNFRQR